MPVSPWLLLDRPVLNTVVIAIRFRGTAFPAMSVEYGVQRGGLRSSPRYESIKPSVGTEGLGLDIWDIWDIGDIG